MIVMVIEMNIKIVVFSSRKNGNCEKIARFISENIHINSNIFCFSEHHITPCGQCHYECFAKDGVCPHSTDGEVELLDGICHANQTIFVLPNYCDYPCANFFIFNERSNGYFQYHPERLDLYLNVPKKFIVVSGSGSEHFREAIWQHSATEPEILFVSAIKCGTASIENQLIHTEMAQNLIEDFLRR